MEVRAGEGEVSGRDRCGGPPRIGGVWPVLVLSIALAGFGAEERQPRDILEREPYMGVSCRVPNSTACDRVGLAVWLREPATYVEASVDGRRFPLDDEEWSGEPDAHERRMFAGFLRPAGLHEDGSLGLGDRDAEWFGGGVSAPVRLWIRRGDGTTQTTTLRIGLHAGWG